MSSNQAPPSATLRFGSFELDPDARTLRENGNPVALGMRALDLLATLASRPGELVTKHEILTRVWPGLVVEENNIQVHVSTLRKLLGARALSTIPGRGYRFDAPVASGAATSAEPVSAALSGPRVDARSNLPAGAPPLFGRDDEIAAVGELVRQRNVVTVVGAGGIGKTRVAKAVAMDARDMHDAFPDGVWWVELATISDGSLVAACVAGALGMSLPPDRDAGIGLAQLVARRKMLVALDNCEHLLDAVAPLVSALRGAAPQLHLLVTSQETLKVPEENVYRIGPLEVPGVSAITDAARSGAVALFVARVQAADPAFALTPANCPGVIEICRRLDGIPLAIEFAAARVPLLGVEGLRTRLDERFKLLTGGARVVLRRHQTLRATLEWSHGLLTPDEQAVFRALATFAGGFTLEAAQHVATDDRIDPWTALDHLGALVDKSLVIAEGDPVPRYRLLETTRAYALERLAESGDTQAMLRRHAEATLASLARFGGVDWHWCATVDELRAAAAEVDNVRAALAWAEGAPEGRRLVVPLAAAAFCVWWATGNMAEGLARCLALRAHVDARVDQHEAAAFHLATARLGNYSVHRESYDAGVTAARMYEALGDARRRFDALTSAAVQGARFGDVREVETWIAQAAAIERPDWPPRQRSCLEFARCWCYARLRRAPEALAAAERQVAINREAGIEVAEHYAMSNVTAMEILNGRTQDAREHARASIERLDVIGAGVGAGHLYRSLALACALEGDAEGALQASRIGYRLLLQEGDEYLLLPALALVTARRGRHEDAARIAAFHRSEHAQMPGNQDALSTFVLERLEPMLANHVGAADRARLDREGSALGADDAFALALR